MSNSPACFMFANSVYASILVLCLGFLPAHAEIASEDFDPNSIGWNRIAMSASKMLLSMSVSVELRRIDDDLPQVRFRTPLKGEPVSSGESVIMMSFGSEGLGRRSDVELLLNSDNGAALQRVSNDSGGKQRRRIYRFTNTGAYRWTWKPLSGEENLSPEAWSDQESKMRPFSASASNQPVTGAGGLIYLIAASRLETPGDRFETFAFSSSSDEVQKVRVEVVSSESTKTNYKEITATGTVRQKKRMDLIRIRILSVPTDPLNDENFELLGMHQVEFLIDPVTRTPLELSGKVPFFGRVTFSLDELTPAK